MKRPEDLRDEFRKTLDHIEVVFDRLVANSGRGRPFSFADAHKLTEGLLLSAWSHWEEFMKDLLVIDVATDRDSALLSEVKDFRLRGGPHRIAQRMLNHPDHPEKYVNWDFASSKSRADSLLPSTHRFTVKLVSSRELQMMKTIRNAVAHKSDKARESFLRLVTRQPFALASNQRKGITVGRFLYCRTWNGTTALKNVPGRLKQWASQLVP